MVQVDHDKLNQSLDEILKTRRTGNRRNARPTRRVANGAKKATVVAPVGGVKKTTRAPKPPKEAPAPTAPTSGDSKINVSNLPFDVTENQIKDYFSKTIGHVKKVLLTYGPNGQSRGICTIIFSKPDSASKAARELDGVKVDKKPMKIEVLVSASQVPPPPAPKSLGDRITGQPKAGAKAKAQPKPVTAPKPAGGKTGPKGRGRPGRGRNVARGKPKTAEELDAEMQDYFAGDANGSGPADTDMNNGGAVQATGGTDTGMEDEIM